MTDKERLEKAAQHRENCERLQSRLESLEKDAARYRWLLRQSWFQSAIDRFDPDDGGMQDRFELECDRIIDAALQSQGATK